MGSAHLIAELERIGPHSCKRFFNFTTKGRPSCVPVCRGPAGADAAEWQTNLESDLSRPQTCAPFDTHSRRAKTACGPGAPRRRLAMGLDTPLALVGRLAALCVSRHLFISARPFGGHICASGRQLGAHERDIKFYVKLDAQSDG